MLVDAIPVVHSPVMQKTVPHRVVTTPMSAAGDPAADSPPARAALLASASCHEEEAGT